ncbi:MAG: glutamate--tRNA ligase, partial [Clostridia bacterium]|nr:glutamate--tRNA ligase [Clostridia bacterium]
EMSEKKSLVRTRFAPSPTGYMHIGNLRTALFAFLFARSQKGTFVLRIEDTDQKRYVADAVDIIYSTLKQAKIIHDEGPDIGGKFAPYIQSERKDIYLKYAQELVESGKAYYCFCDKQERVYENDEQSGYNRKCRNLSLEDAKELIKKGQKYVIRQKMPLEGKTKFNDLVYEEIEVENEMLEDQILIKGDGMPTYNFANVIDDHLMEISHIIRGADFLSSTPKYKLLYEAFGWQVPHFVHLPLIMGMNNDGTVSKLSKRHGATSFQELVAQGFLSEAIINYIALLGWNPKNEGEIFSIEELQNIFNLAGVSKSSAIFDYNKLAWMNSLYIKEMSEQDFAKKAKGFVGELPTQIERSWNELAALLKSRIKTFSEVPSKIKFLLKRLPFDLNIFINKKNKTTFESSLKSLQQISTLLKDVEIWEIEEINRIIKKL